MTLLARGRRTAFAGVALLLVWSGCAKTTAPPAAPGAPRFPDYGLPGIPATLAADARTRQEHEDAWARLQAGDLRRARTEYADLLKRLPAFYPAETALGYVELASPASQGGARSLRRRHHPRGPVHAGLARAGRGVLGSRARCRRHHRHGACAHARSETRVGAGPAGARPFQAGAVACRDRAPGARGRPAGPGAAAARAGTGAFALERTYLSRAGARRACRGASSGGRGICAACRARRS